MKFFLFIANFLFLLCLVCEDLKRPKSKYECFDRTFVGEYNNENAYCCHFQFEKNGVVVNKCSVHFKNEIDNGQVSSTIDFLKEVNTQKCCGIKFISFDCKQYYIKFTYLFFVLILF